MYCKEEAASIGSSGLCKSEGRHCTELHPSIFIFFDRAYNFHRNMGGSAKWKMHKIRSQRIRGSRVSSQRIHGSRLDLDRMIRISGNLPPHLQSRSRSAGNMPGSASSSGEPMCALKDSVTISYSIARVDGLGGDEDGRRGCRVGASAASERCR